MNRAFPARESDDRSWAALPVSCDNAAESYLLQVRQEARTIPDVMCSSSTPAALAPRSTRPPPPKPHTVWEASALEAFSALHAYMSECEAFRDAGGKLPTAHALPHWRVFFLGEAPSVRAKVPPGRRREAVDIEDWPSSDDGAAEEDEGEDAACAPASTGASPPPHAPWLSAVMALDQRGVRQVLGAAIAECEARGGGLSLHQALWLYGLLARLERPLLSSDGAAVRQLFTLCTALRTRRGLGDPPPSSAVGAGEGSAVETRGGPERSVAAAIDTLVLVTGTYFGQRLSHE